MTLEEHAKQELTISGMFDEDSDYNGMLAKSIMELITVFSKQGHSGASASMCSSIFDTLSRFKSLAPLTGDDDEWAVGMRDGICQNKRNSAVFKNMKTGLSYYIDAISWNTPNNIKYHGTADGIASTQYI